MNLFLYRYESNDSDSEKENESIEEVADVAVTRRNRQTHISSEEETPTIQDRQKEERDKGKRGKAKKMTPAMQKLRDALEKSVNSPQKPKDTTQIMTETPGSTEREVFTPIPKDRKSSHGQYQVRIWI